MIALLNGIRLDKKCPAKPEYYELCVFGRLKRIISPNMGVRHFVMKITFGGHRYFGT